MIKKWFAAGTIGAALTLSACGSETTEVNEESETTASEGVDETEETTETEQVEEEEPLEDVEEIEEDTGEGEDVQEDDSLKATNTYTNKELGITGEAGPIQYEIPGIQLKILEPKDQATADLFEVEVGDEVHAFTIQLAGENTSDKDMNFYLGQATAITNTKEQLEPDMLMSEHINGEYLGQVRHEGHNVYILENSTVDELETIELRISAPTDENFESQGEDISHTIEVNQ